MKWVWIGGGVIAIAAGYFLYMHIKGSSQSVTSNQLSAIDAQNAESTQAFLYLDNLPTRTKNGKLVAGPGKQVV